MLENSVSILTDKLSTWYEAVVAMLPNAVLAILIMIAFGIASRVAGRLAKRLAESMADSEAVTFLIASLARYSVLSFGVFVSLGVVGMQKTVTSLLAGAGIVGLAIGFAFQDLAANFIAGVMMGFRKPFSVGDVVKTRDFIGMVQMINLRNTILDTFEGQRVIVPNKDVFQNALVNYSTTGHRRVDIEVGVAHDSNLDDVTSVGRQALGSLDFIDPDKEVEVLARGFGGSSIDFELRFWIPYPDGAVGYPEAIHRGVLAVKRAFDENGIEIPFPIRTLDFAQTTQTPARLTLTNGPAEGHAESAEAADPTD